MGFKFLIILITASLMSCSKNEKNNQENQIENLSDQVQFEALSIKTSLVAGENKIPEASLDFATLQQKQSASQDLIITNGLVSGLVFGPNDIDSSNISPFVVSETCSNKTIARNRSCKLTFSIVNNPNPTELVLSKSLTIKGTVIQLTATLAPDLTPVDAPIVSLIVSPTSLDFGSMKNGEQKELSIAITNKGTTTQAIAAPVISNPKLFITSNTCSSLIRNRSCSIKVRYTASDDEVINQEVFTSIVNNDIKYSVLVQSPTVNEPQVLTINPSISSSSLNLTEPQIHNGSLSFTNTGTISLPSPVQLVAQPSNGVSVNSVSCSGGLSRNRNCLVSYSINSSLVAGGLYQIQLKLQSGTLSSNAHIINLNVNKLDGPCTLADALLNNVDISNSNSIISGIKTGENVSACILAENACNHAYQRNVDGKSCQLGVISDVQIIPFAAKGAFNPMNGSTDYLIVDTATNSYKFSTGTTKNAKKISIFSDSYSCENHKINECYKENAFTINPMCDPMNFPFMLPFFESNLSSENADIMINAFDLNNLLGNSMGTVFSYYSNEISTTSCFPMTVGFDYNPPAILMGYNPGSGFQLFMDDDKLPSIQFGTQSLDFYDMESGLGKVYYGVSSVLSLSSETNLAYSGNFDKIPYTDISAQVLENYLDNTFLKRIDMPIELSGNLGNEQYVVFLRIHDKVGNIFYINSMPFSSPCPNETLTNGACPPETGFSKIEVGDTSSCVISNRKKLYCWGNNMAGQYGNGEFGIPTQVSLNNSLLYKSSVINIEDIDIGFGHACAKMQDNYFNCWGANGNRILGNSGFTAWASASPVMTDSYWLPENKASSLFISNNSCAIGINGQAYCWGHRQYSGSYFATSTSNLGYHEHPVPVNNDVGTPLHGKTIVLARSGAFSKCVLTSDRQFICWGDYGILQNGYEAQLYGTPGYIQPTDLSYYIATIPLNENIIDLQIGYAQACALTNADKLYCWGHGASGELGYRPLTYAEFEAENPGGLYTYQPAYFATEVVRGEIPLNHKIKKLKLAMAISCVIAGLENDNSADKLYCWGQNNYNQISPNTINDDVSGQSHIPENSTYVPTSVNDNYLSLANETIKDFGLSISASYTCALTHSNKIYCWGSNAGVQIDNQSFVILPEPYLIYDINQ